MCNFVKLTLFYDLKPACVHCTCHFVDFIRHETVILVNCYSKSDKGSLTNKEKAMYKEFVKEIGKGL